MGKHFKKIWQWSFLFIFSALSFTKSTAQNGVIKGLVKDADQLPLEFVSVALLKPTDSTMVSFAITDTEGKFEINDADKGSFILQAFLTGFYPKYFQIDFNDQLIDLGSIGLDLNIAQLEEVTITAVVPVQIKQDTIAFNANAFKVGRDDTIEDLLKKLPGIELNNDGTIVSQGNEITKIYVDGKEFFSGDPAIALKNLAADAIHKIEVIDKKSEEAELTGLADDQRSYVINLTLKKNKKRIGFGKLSGGIGLDNKFFSNLNYNKFQPKKQLSLIGKFNNINVTSSNIQDFLSFAGGLGDEGEEDPETTSGSYSKPKQLSGVLTTAAGGIHTGYELKKKELINADYFYNFSENTGSTTSKRTSFSKLNNFDSEYEEDLETSSNKHQLNFNYENKNKSDRRFFVKGNYTSDKIKSSTNRANYFYNEEGILRNSSDNIYLNETERGRGNVRMNYYRRFGESKRNFNWAVVLSTNNRNNLRDLYSEITKAFNNKLTTVSTLKDEVFKYDQVNASIRYTEPLGGNHYLKVQAGFLGKFSREHVQQEKTRNQLDAPALNYRLKNSEKNFNSQLIYNFNTPKLNFNLGTEFQDFNRDLNLENANALNKKNLFANPFASLRYKPKKGKNYSLNFRRFIRQPQNFHLAPIVNELNPYSIRSGNPSLVAEKINELKINMVSHNYSEQLSLFGKFQYQNISDPIIQSLIIDENYVKHRSYENYIDLKRLSGTLNLNKRVRKYGIRYNLKVNSGFNTAYSIIENELNEIESKRYLVGASLENNKKQKADIKIGIDYSNNTTSFSVLENLDRNFYELHYFAKIDYDLTKRFNINTQFDYYSFDDDNFNSNQNIPFWNASLSYSLDAEQQSTLKLIMIDILDENINILRRSTLNFFEETIQQSLGRYFVISFTYRLNGGIQKNGASKT